MRLLARREHSLMELRRKLALRHFEAPQIERVLLALRAGDLQSDARFAESGARVASGRGRGPVYIRHHLGACGVSEEDVAAALAAYREQWPALAATARARKFGEEPPVGPAQHRKQMQFLLRRGFTAEQARQALSGCRAPAE